MSSDINPGPKAFDAFHDYWNQLLLARRAIERPVEGECPVPFRTDFNPMKVHRQLPHVYIVEWQSSDMLEVRLSGTALDETAGYALQGGNYFDLCAPKEKPFFAKLIAPVVGQPCGLKMSRGITLTNGQAHQLRSLSFPLADKEGTPRYIVGMMNVIRDIPMSVHEEIDHPRSEINGFTYIDIGAGTPTLPDTPIF